MTLNKSTVIQPSIPLDEDDSNLQIGIMSVDCNVLGLSHVFVQHPKVDNDAPTIYFHLKPNQFQGTTKQISFIMTVFQDQLYLGSIRSFVTCINSKPENKTTSSVSYGVQNRNSIKTILTDYFNLSEIEEICFDFGFSSEDFSRQGGKPVIIRQLIEWMEHRELIPELVQKLFVLRPNISIWQNLDPLGNT